MASYISPSLSPSMETSPHSTSSSSSSSGGHTATLAGATTTTAPLLHSPKPITRSDPNNPYPTTFVQADTTSFKQVVQMLTGSPRPTYVTDPNPNPNPTTKPHSHNFSIPPIKSIPKKNQSSSGFKLYERRNSLKNLKINPLNAIFNPQSSGFSPRKPDILSPSVLDFPALVLSPVTPLIPDPFVRSGSASFGSSSNKNTCFSPMSVNNNNNDRTNNGLVDCDAEDRAIKEKGFFLHPSPREAEPPRLLPLFPVTSPRVTGSADS